MSRGVMGVRMGLRDGKLVGIYVGGGSGDGGGRRWGCNARGLMERRLILTNLSGGWTTALQKEAHIEA